MESTPDCDLSAEVNRLKDEVAVLNNLLEESALTLHTLNSKVSRIIICFSCSCH